jgi:tetratricopeptide (TPR) repeat protein
MLLVCCTFQTKAQKNLDSLVQMIEKTSGVDRVSIFNQLASEYSVSNLTECKKYCSLALKLADSLNYRKGVADAYYNKSRSVTGLDNLGELQFLTKALDIYSELNDQRGMGDCYIQMGVIHYRIDNDSLAIMYYKKALGIYDQIEDLSGKARAFRLAGNIYKKKGENNLALRFYTSSVELASKVNDKRLLANSLNNLGISYMEMNRLENALDVLERSLKLNIESNNVTRVPAAYYNISEIYMRQKKIDEALKSLQNGRKEALKWSKHDPILVDIDMGLAQIYSIKNNYREGYNSLLELIAIKDTLLRSEVSLEVAKFEALESNRKLELLKLQREKELRENEYENKLASASFWIVLLISLLLLAIGIVTILSLRARMRKDRFSILLREEVLKNEFKVKLAQSELSTLKAQMNPHFIFNSLNSINHFILKSSPNIASDYLAKFSKLIRMILDNSIYYTISLQQELNAIKLYVELEQLRFDGRFFFDLEISQMVDTANIQVPPLIMQPYIENAILHGLTNKSEGGKIKVTIERDADYVIYSIEDNGIGRDKAGEIEKNHQPKGKSHGTRITLDRLTLMTHDSVLKASIDTIDLTNELSEPAGTKVIIKIPLSMSTVPEIV